MSKPSDETKHDRKTRLAHAGRDPWRFDGFVNPPVYRGSTVLFPTLDAIESGNQRYVYGRRGTPTVEALEEIVAEMEGGARTVLVPSGLAAVTSTLLALTKAGDHILVSDSVYKPTRLFASGMLSRFGVTVEYYDPLIAGGIASLIRDNTSMIYCESPGSQTFEMQDLPAISEARGGRDIWLVVDNTWASPLYCNPFRLGADVSIQAGTKYVVGHADALLGTVTANERARLPVVKGIQDAGHCAGSEEVFLGLRGIRTLAVRLERHWRSGITVASWLETRPEVARVLHPALPSHPGHAIWKRDFTGASSLFSVVLKPVPREGLRAFVESLKLFGMGFSWGGFESLVVPFDPRSHRSATAWDAEGPCLRFHIGLEEAEDLLRDLERGFSAMARAAT
ncbi:MAG: cystathionine beta-lyase [Rhizobiales bacterium]|nr:cystathionine beta-lyase [Hyphomicrobiales bacterium]